MTRNSLTQLFRQGLRGILNVQSQVSKTHNQISANTKILTPADDPVGAARVLELEAEQSRVDQYKKNINGATTSLQLEDTQLDTISNLLARVRELTVNAGDGALSQSERKAIAEEMA